jgi:hypothetical protein
MGIVMPVGTNFLIMQNTHWPLPAAGAIVVRLMLGACPTGNDGGDAPLWDVHSRLVLKQRSPMPCILLSIRTCTE